MATRGIRNNNPGNIRHSKDEWQGEVDGTDTAFKTFSDPLYGLRALAKLMLNYQAKHGLNTVAALIDRWAPPVENQTAVYANAVAKALGVEPTAVIQVSDHLPALVAAIVTHENGSQPYSADLIQQACDMAMGVSNAPKSEVVAPAPVQPPAHVLPAPVLLDSPGDGTTMGDAVRAVGVPAAARLIPILKGLATSKTEAGVIGLLALQLLGVNAWDVAIRIGGQIYAVPDLSPYFAAVLAAIATWGRITAKPIGGSPRA